MKKNLWPMLPVVILGATVLANIVLIRLATNTDDHILAEDYYEQGLQQEAEISERAHQARDKDDAAP